MRKKVNSFTALVMAMTLLCSCSPKIDSIETEQDSSILSKTSSRDVVSIIKKANQVYEKRDSELVKLKYEGMKESPHSFYRATNYLFYQDFAKTNLFNAEQVTIQGDLHLENIGTYKSANGFSYDFNDFDDAIKGSYTYDLARVSTSIILVAQENGFSKSDAEKFATQFLESYLDYTKKLKGNSTELNNPISEKYMSDKVKKLVKNVSETTTASFNSSFISSGNLMESKKVKKLDTETYKRIFVLLKIFFAKNNPSYTLKDVAYYISGKGSLGRYRYLALLQNTTRPSDTILMDIKEAVKTNFSTATENQAQRVINGTKFFLAKPNMFLATTNIEGNDFFVRSLLPDDKVDLSKLNKSSEMEDFVKTISYLTARGHSKSNKNDKILSEQKRVIEIKDFAVQYAEQVKADFNQFRKNI